MTSKHLVQKNGAVSSQSKLGYMFSTDLEDELVLWMATENSSSCMAKRDQKKESDPYFYICKGLKTSPENALSSLLHINSCYEVVAYSWTYLNTEHVTSLHFIVYDFLHLSIGIGYPERLWHLHPQKLIKAG